MADYPYSACTMAPNTSTLPFKPGLQNGESGLNTFNQATHSKMPMLKDLTEQFATNGCHNITGRAWKRFKSLPPGGCGHITIIVRIWLWVDLHLSRNWPQLHNVSTFDSLAKGEDHPKEECLNEKQFQNLPQVKYCITEWRKGYNEVRLLLLSSLQMWSFTLTVFIVIRIYNS